MRIVADTNVILSAFLWGGTPRQLLDAAEAGRLELFTSREIIAELEDVLSREKFATSLGKTRFTAAYLLARYTQLAALIVPAEITVPELRDPKDLPILACALAAKAHCIVSGDAHLLNLKYYQRIPILDATRAMKSLVR